MTAPATDPRGLVLEPDHVARQRFIDEREKMFALSRRIEASLAEYDRIVGSAGYPFAGKAFDRAYSDVARAAYGVFRADELSEIADAYDPDSIVEDERGVAVIDQRFL